MKISIVALSALTVLSLQACNTPDKEEKPTTKEDPASTVDSISAANPDSMKITEDYCPPCGRG